MKAAFIQFLKQLAAIVVLYGAYVVAAQLGLMLDSTNTYATLIWAPSGIAIAALVLYGMELWPGVLLGAFTVNTLLGGTVPVAMGIALGNTLEALTGAYVLREHFKLSPMFSRLQDSLGFIFVSFTTPFIAASIASAVLLIGGDITSIQLGQTWFVWWVGDSLGMLIVGAFLLRWLHRPFFTKTYAELIEGTLLFGLLFGVNFLIFWTNTSQIGGVPLLYVLFIPLIWAALRAGPRGMTLALLLTTGISIAAGVTDQPGFLQTFGTHDLLLLETLIGVLGIVFLIFASIVEERKQAMVILKDHVGRLEDALDRIRHEDEAKAEFIATLAHELRNPLSPIVSAVELIQTQGVTAHTPAQVHTIETHVHTMVRLLDDLLDISRISRKKFKLQKETVELQSIINHSRETVAAFYASRNHTLTIAVPAESVWVYADPVRLEQIFVNLLFNAGKYTNPGGTVALTTTHEGKRVVVHIKDTGIGVQSHMLTKIFEPFVQVNTLGGGRQLGTGLGLGLSLTKRLVELHGGKIWAESPGKNKGSTFTVELPVSDAPLSSTELAQTYGTPSPLQIPPQHARRHKILLVDDNEAAAQGLGTLLAHNGHEVELAYNGKGALGSLHTFGPRVVLLDIGLPDMDGYEVAKQLSRESAYPLTLIALTGYGQAEDKQKAKNAGFHHHLTKPVQVTDVERVLRHVVV